MKNGKKDMHKNWNRFYQKFLALAIMAFFIPAIFSGCQGISTVEENLSLPEEKSLGRAGKDVGSDMEVHFLDVGQADATLVILDDAAMLIDGGNQDDEEMILGYLDNQGIQKLDYVIGTHPHEDHIGSLDAVIEHYEIGEVILPDKIHTTLTYESLLNAIDEKGLSITLPEVGRQYQLGDAIFTILAPGRDYEDNLNNWSVGLRLVYGQDSFLFSGDAEKQAEEDILQSGLKLKSDVFKVSHHGSDTSNSSDYLEAVSPTYGVISCGRDNAYGHPNREVLEDLENRRVQIFRTDEQGTIHAVSSGSGITWSTQPSVSKKAGSGEKEQAETEEESIPAVSADEAVEKILEESEEVTVHITKSGKKYHRQGCRYLSSSDMKVTLEEAGSLGLEPCQECKPPK